MGKNLIGGNKQKKKKRVRNNITESHNFKNIAEPCVEECTYYGKVLKSYGSKFEVYIFGLGRIVDSKIRGSRQMKWKCPKLSITKNPYVIIEFNEKIYKFGTILWVYKEWEYRELMKRGFIFNFDKDKLEEDEDELFDYDEKKEDKKLVAKKKSYHDTMEDIYAEMDKKLAESDDMICYEHEKEEIEKKDKLNRINLN